MPGWSFKFDPVTNDLIDDGKGSFARTFHADTHIQLQLRCHAQKCWQDSLLGSFLYDTNRFQSDPLKLAPAEVKRSLNVLVSRGRIGNLAVTATEPKPGRVDVAAKARDTSTNAPVGAFVKAGG